MNTNKNDIESATIDLEKNLISKKIPNHIAIIMDGNGRWAKKNNKIRTYGHIAGVKTLKEIIEYSVKINVNYLSVYAFSSENWKRPKKEVEFLLKLLNEQITSETHRSKKQGIRVRIIGSRTNLGPKIIKSINQIEETTKDCNKLNLNIFINYGSREELITAFNSINTQSLNPPITEKLISQHLYTSELPDPDILIRTSGEKRISNFLLWQLSYTELFFSDTLWPDFNKYEFLKIIINYQQRQRRFGGL
jgi:undecaprenyl diphosphate synthase